MSVMAVTLGKMTSSMPACLASKTESKKWHH
jgi:hypothetical protein